ncbi:MAG: methionyl-tRNA formyltransferase [Pseudomonadota bacterium]|nr:methionyl-tRNA formyltransferase [Pseudomonadota bacterium]
MRIALLGQQKFGQAVLEAFLQRGDTVAGVFCSPDKVGAAPDALRMAAEHHGIAVHQLASLRTPEAREILHSLAVDLGVMAYVLQFVPEEFRLIPARGTIQYHPSLLPRYRGPSAINWPIIHGDSHTGLTIFSPTDGLDEGPVILQEETPIGPDETVGDVYFGRLFPMGVAALLRASELVMSGAATARAQDEARASYEGWCRAPEAHINWHNHVDQVYNLIRGCNPAPGAWTLFNGKKLQLFDSRKHPARRASQVAGNIGSITAVGDESMHVTAQGGQIEVFRVRYEGGEKMPAARFCAAAGVSLGSVLGT